MTVRRFRAKRLAIGLLSIVSCRDGLWRTDSFPYWEHHCGDYDRWSRDETEPFQEDYGTAKISVLSIAPWEEIEPKLIPHFRIDAATALEPDVTRSGSARTLFELLAGPNASGDKASVPAAPADGTPAVDGGAAPKAATIQTNTVDAQTRYELGLALFQEVQLMDNYLSYAVGAGHRKRAYLVTIDVGLLPTRQAPVDAYVDLSFLPFAPNPVDRDLRPPTVTAIPIVASDILELDHESATQQEVFELGVALQSISKDFSGDLLARYEHIHDVIGRNINSLQLVTTTGRSSMDVRFGAAQQVGPDYSLVPQSRRIHCLMIVDPNGLSDEDADKFNYVVASKTEFTAVHSSADIPFRKERQLERDVACRILQETGEFIDPDRNHRLIEQLESDYEMGDSQQFRKDLESYRNGRPLDRFSNRQVGPWSSRSEHYAQWKEYRLYWEAFGDAVSDSLLSSSLLRLPVRRQVPPILPTSGSKLMGVVRTQEIPRSDGGVTELSYLAIDVPGPDLLADLASWRLEADGAAFLPMAVEHRGLDVVEVHFPTPIAQLVGPAVPDPGLAVAAQNLLEAQWQGYAANTDSAKQAAADAVKAASAAYAEAKGNAAVPVKNLELTYLGPGGPLAYPVVRLLAASDKKKDSKSTDSASSASGSIKVDIHGDLSGKAK